MKDRRWTIVLVAWGALAVITLLAASVKKERAGAPGPPLPTERVTIVQDDAEFLHRPDAQVRSGMRDLRALGVDWLRVTAGWSVIAPGAGSPRRPAFDATNPDAYPAGAWAGLDRLFSQAREAGLEVMVDIAFWAPRWAVNRATEPGRERWDVKPDDYGDFAEAVARRYPEAVAFAVWNEPNYRLFLLPQHVERDGRWLPASPHLYRSMLYSAAPRIRRAAPRALLLIGNTAAAGAPNAASPEEGVSPMTFLREMACVDASLKPLDRPECRGFKPLPGDGFAHHPYTPRTLPSEPDPDPDHVRVTGLGRLDALLARLSADGRTERRLALFATEYGYETNPPDPRQPWTPAQQATLLNEAELIAHRAAPALRGWPQFLLRDLGPRPAPAAERWSDVQSGLRFPGGTRKPAWAAFQMPLVVRPAPGGALRIEGRVRPHDARGEIGVEARVAGRWAPARGVRGVKTDSDGFYAVVLAPSGATAVRVRAGVLVSPELALAAD